MVMKQSQWAIAAFVLAALVFLVTFAMNYLGSRPQSSTGLDTKQAGGEVRFFWKLAPVGEPGSIEAEERAPGSHDFWFTNDNPTPVTIGLEKVSCKCSAVELFLLPTNGPRLLACEAAALVGAGWLGHVPLFAMHSLALPCVHKTAGAPHELIQGTESVSMPPGAVGWVRLRWKGERTGPQALEARLYFEGKDSGKTALLRTQVYFHEPLRVRPALNVGPLSDEDLKKGVKQEIICWSSTRRELRLEAKRVGRTNPAADPFVVGKPQRLSLEEVRALERANNPIKPTGPDPTIGMVLCAYRIPVTLNAVSQNGTPFDIGPFYRRVTLVCPDIAGEPKQVTIHGRVRGVVEIGNDQDGSEISFSTFPRSKGKTDRIHLTSEVLGLTLQFDDKRTPPYLTATLSPPKTQAGRQTWVLRATVLPGQASGVFPRRDDPLFEDSAIYLKATEAGKPIRWVRIAVQGTASEG
jgi:hypothetical protein